MSEAAVLTLTLSQMFQLYAPLAGLLVVVFMLGGLFNRVKTIERELKELKENADAIGNQRDRLTVLETLMSGMQDDMKGVKQSLEGVQRQLGNVVGKLNGAKAPLDFQMD